jgi:hypothetical protein
VKAGLIEHKRGKVIISNRQGLEAASCECYGEMQDELDEFLPRQKTTAQVLKFTHPDQPLVDEKRATVRNQTEPKANMRLLEREADSMIPLDQKVSSHEQICRNHVQK